MATSEEILRKLEDVEKVLFLVGDRQGLSGMRCETLLEFVRTAERVSTILQEISVMAANSFISQNMECLCGLCGEDASVSGVTAWSFSEHSGIKSPWLCHSCRAHRENEVESVTAKKIPTEEVGSCVFCGCGLREELGHICPDCLDKPAQDMAQEWEERS